jgi:hypothetical protein
MAVFSFYRALLSVWAKNVPMSSFEQGGPANAYQLGNIAVPLIFRANKHCAVVVHAVLKTNNPEHIARSEQRLQSGLLD